jgi:hypothetical protein
MVNEEGLSALGALPRVAFDVITVAYGNSVIPFIASVQNIEEERGNVYFKVLKRGDTGATIIDPRSGEVLPQGLSLAEVSDKEVATGDGSTTTFNVTLDPVPVRPETFEVKADSVYGKDDGKGNILGIGVWGTIDYKTGAVTLNFASAPASGVSIVVNYQIDIEAKGDIPSIKALFEAVPVRAKIYALKGVVGLLQSFALRQRFGIVAEDELAKDLVVAINDEIGGDLIRKMNANAGAGTITWDKTPPTGVSYFEHKQQIKDKIADIEGLMANSAGRGIVNVIIAGSKVASILSTLPGFKKLATGKDMGAHIYGELDGVTVIRVNDTNTLPANVLLGVYNPDNPFEGAAVYAPYMPLTTTDLIPLSPNPLTNQRAAAVWAAVEVLIPQFVGKLEVQNA